MAIMSLKVIKVSINQKPVCEFFFKKTDDLFVSPLLRRATTFLAVVFHPPGGDARQKYFCC